MKWISYSFALYIAVIAAYPCYEEGCEVYCGSEVELQADHGNEMADICSPFCNDGCCLIHVCCPETSTCLHTKRFIVQIDWVYLEDFNDQQHAQHWQPPKIYS